MSRKSRPLTQTDGNFRPIQDSELWTTFRGAYTGTNLIYAGFARPGSTEAQAVWQLRRMTYDGSNNLTHIEYPINSDGTVSSDYEFTWSGRAGYTYA